MDLSLYPQLQSLKFRIRFEHEISQMIDTLLSVTSTHFRSIIVAYSVSSSLWVDSWADFDDFLSNLAFGPGITLFIETTDTEEQIMALLPLSWDAGVVRIKIPPTTIVDEITSWLNFTRQVEVPV